MPKRMDKLIKIGYTNNGPMSGAYDKYKACNLCTNFIGYGMHHFCGKCKIDEKEIGLFDYHKIAKNCSKFNCEEELSILKQPKETENI